MIQYIFNYIYYIQHEICFTINFKFTLEISIELYYLQSKNNNKKLIYMHKISEHLK